MSNEILTVTGLRAGYDRIPILFGIDFNVASGEFVGILGHNGMGKSTLLKTLMGHLPATGGKIIFDGDDITSLSPAQRARRGLGYVPQGRQIFPALNALDNLRVGAARLDRASASHAIERVLEELPRLKPILTRAGGVLSGGEQQILALGRCLCSQPRLVLLDEPTEGIQPSIIEEMKEILRALSRSRRMSVLLVEQNLDFISDLADRVLVIQRGLLSEEVDPEVLRRGEVVAGYLPSSDDVIKS
ncbi:MAG: ABC transporter ATP-binding protein [Rhizobiaceae bacterium]|nr:MAG: ABC transporter ATP-binding protein [Rhizobiaceae bacterium]